MHIDRMHHGAFAYDAAVELACKQYNKLMRSMPRPYKETEVPKHTIVNNEEGLLGLS